jgi:hypothetical protein
LNLGNMAGDRGRGGPSHVLISNGSFHDMGRADDQVNMHSSFAEETTDKDEVSRSMFGGPNQDYLSAPMIGSTDYKQANKVGPAGIFAAQTNEIRASME